MSVVVRFEDFEGAAARARRGMRRGMVAYMLKLQKLSQVKVTAMEAVDTGFLLNSAYLEGCGQNGRDAALSVARAHAKEPGQKSGRTHEGPEGEPQTATGPNRLKLAYAANYAQAVHDGTPSMEARPFVQEALDETRHEVGDIVAQVVADALRSGI